MVPYSQRSLLMFASSGHSNAASEKAKFHNVDYAICYNITYITASSPLCHRRDTLGRSGTVNLTFVG